MLSHRISAGFGSRGFRPTIFGFGALKPIRFGFKFSFLPVDIQNKSLELIFIFYNMVIITCLLRLCNLF